MIFDKIRSPLITIITVCMILAVAGIIITYGRGYRLNFSKKSLDSTGLLVVSSEPSGSQIIINDKVQSATPNTLTLTPNWYKVTIVKDGFQTWEKQVKIQGEVVTKIEALLLPTNPSLAALTASGVLNPVLSPDGTKLAYIVPPDKIATNSSSLAKPGVWVLDLADKPLSLNRDARQLSNDNRFNYNKITLKWSPDSKQILSCQNANNLGSLQSCFTLETDKFNQTPVTVPNLKLLQNNWQEQTKLREKEKLLAYPKEFTGAASTSAKLLAFSPDETKILYLATASATIPQSITPAPIGTNTTQEDRNLTPGNYYVYDLKEDRNYRLGDVKDMPSLSWLPTSKHLLIIQKDKIEIMEYDGSIRKTAYAGPFAESFAVPWANGSKIVILTNLNRTASAINNLYAVNLK